MEDVLALTPKKIAMRELTETGLMSVDKDEDGKVRRSSSKLERIWLWMKELVESLKEVSPSAAVRVGWLKAAMKLMWWRAASEVWYIINTADDQKIKWLKTKIKWFLRW